MFIILKQEVFKKKNQLLFSQKDLKIILIIVTLKSQKIVTRKKEKRILQIKNHWKKDRVLTSELNKKECHTKRVIQVKIINQNQSKQKEFNKKTKVLRKIIVLL